MFDSLTFAYFLFVDVLMRTWLSKSYIRRRKEKTQSCQDSFFLPLLISSWAVVCVPFSRPPSRHFNDVTPWLRRGRSDAVSFIPDHSTPPPPGHYPPPVCLSLPLPCRPSIRSLSWHICSLWISFYRLLPSVLPLSLFCAPVLRANFPVAFVSTCLAVPPHRWSGPHQAAAWDEAALITAGVEVGCVDSRTGAHEREI